METHGALVGWTHQDFGDRMMLKIESVRTTEAAVHHEPDVFRVLMTKNQAAILGHFLIHNSGLAPADPGRGWFRRLFG